MCVCAHEKPAKCLLPKPNSMPKYEKHPKQERGAKRKRKRTTRKKRKISRKIPKGYKTTKRDAHQNTKQAQSEANFLQNN